jgi:protein-S-isoprenylcysteine O-methyltransferase Ste14
MAMGRFSDGAKVLFPPPLVYVIGLALGIGAGRLLKLPGLGLGSEPELRGLIGGLAVVAGLVVGFVGAGLFLRQRTAIVPFKPASHLVTSGIYGWTRNPMYAGMALSYAGVAVVSNSLAALVLLPLVLATIQGQVIAREEAYLERAFGSAYVAYKNRVRRWI